MSAITPATIKVQIPSSRIHFPIPIRRFAPGCPSFFRLNPGTSNEDNDNDSPPVLTPVPQTMAVLRLLEFIATVQTAIALLRDGGCEKRCVW